MSALQPTLRRVFGLRALRVGQQEVIDRVLAGHSTLAVMPTGAGKSLCYQLPAVASGGLTLVISPLIALMKDQCEGLRGRGIAAAQLNSAVDAGEREHALALISSGHGARIVFTTPERFTDPATLALLQAQRVSLMVVDEAHCIAQWGHDFRPAFSALRQARRALGQTPVLALTATATGAVQDEICGVLGIPRDGVLQHGIYRQNLELRVEVLVSEKQRLGRIVECVKASSCSTIVYAATVRQASRIHEALTAAGETAALYHGKLSARRRYAVQDAFMGGGVRVMVATNAFGMGIDKADIGLIVHAQMPSSLEAYCQECGRAGRDGAAARCVLLFREGDRALQQFFARGRHPRRDQLAAVWQTLRAQTPQTGWLPAALATAARVSVHRTKQILAALGAVRAVARKAGGGLRAAAASQQDAQVVALAHQHLDAREGRSRDGLEAMVMYAKGGSCRWLLLMDHFGQTLATPRCGHCDVCQSLAALQQAADAAPVEAAAELPQPPRRPFEPGAAVVVLRFGRGVVKDCNALAVAIEFEDHAVREIDPGFVTLAAAHRDSLAARDGA